MAKRRTGGKNRRGGKKAALTYIELADDECFKMSPAMRRAAANMNWNELENLLKRGESFCAKDSAHRTIVAVAMNSYSSRLQQLKLKSGTKRKPGGDTQASLDSKLENFLHLCFDYQNFLEDKKRLSRR